MENGEWEIRLSFFFVYAEHGESYTILSKQLNLLNSWQVKILANSKTRSLLHKFRERSR
ncbi:MAG TPA: hypothetical protein V6C91_07420 [Coleofasciculaceae cyanobacterium]